MVVAHHVRCSNCGAPVDFEPGDLYTDCKYCGFTTVIETGKAFDFEHSLLLNKFDEKQIETPIKQWMEWGFLKPSDLSKKSKITEKSLVYLPFWVVSVQVKSVYKGIFERINPSIIKEGALEKEYNWLILARKSTVFPTREYAVPLEAKIPFDFRKIERFAKVMNSETDKNEAFEQAKQQIESHHRFLLQKDVDRIVELKSDFGLKQTVYLHAPLWYIKYDYRGRIYQLLIDGASGTTVKADIPQKGFGMF